MQLLTDWLTCQGVDIKWHNKTQGLAKEHRHAKCGGTGRKYNRKLFGVPDRMLWVTGVTLFERAKELEDWGMEVIAEAFPDFCVNKVDSALSKKYISIDQPNGCY